ncbi:MAG: hypothetical protein AB1604_03670 [Euryarchaeota archaeon]
MNRLVKNLYERGLIKKINDENSWNNIVESDFIEIQGKFNPNPLVTSLKKINGVLNLILDLNELSNSSDPINDEGYDSDSILQAHENPMNMDTVQVNEMSLMQGLIKKLIDDLEGKNYQKYVIHLKDLPDHRIVSYLFNEYIRDRSGAELPYGEFKLLGKVVRKIHNGDAIDLLQGSALGVNEEIIQGFVNPLSQLPNEGFDIPEIFTKVESPALQVIPVAVFV